MSSVYQVFKSLVDEGKILVENQQKSPSSEIMFFSGGSISSTIKFILSRKSTKLKMESGKILSEYKITVQSHDQANNSLDLD